MSIDHNGALLYGFSIHRPTVERGDWRERVDHVLKNFDNVGYAECDLESTGRIYLCAFFESVDRYDPVKRFPIVVDEEEYARWDGLLSGAARALGARDHDTPEWTLVSYED